ncbi:hypothetical protein RB619_01485 [Flavobacterium sp. LHD-80]|uniref:hypothetical protein n=1 Tax=Flavobacterium sp. LHD-80 TaxID=3071411 RepID=UPI0027DF4141|nr:hypothetical protein [Flavobacterium sp. LHD-80]MDQ6469296.1 hypothetical protein [Flavobacterium sp. LHD-80]
MQTKLLILIVVIFSSCTCREAHLTKDEREWFSAYQKGQQLIFKSNLANMDTITITDKVERYGNKDCNWFEIGSVQNNMINIDLKTKTCKNESYCGGGISISKDKENERSFPSFSLFGLIYSKLF